MKKLSYDLIIAGLGGLLAGWSILFAQFVTELLNQPKNFLLMMGISICILAIISGIFIWYLSKVSKNK